MTVSMNLWEVSITILVLILAYSNYHICKYIDKLQRREEKEYIKRQILKELKEEQEHESDDSNSEVDQVSR